ncbi:MAG: quinate 5-dehydrogenase [Trueperaceae bacterium]
MSSSNRKHVLSISPGSSQRDSYIETELLGTPIILERRGTDGDIPKAAKMIEALDGKIDAFGLGGMDIFIQAAGRRYYLRDGVTLASHAKKTPIVCGAGLKDTLERIVVKDLDKTIQWQNKNVLMVSAVDRFGMAEALAEAGADVLYGDLIFGLGLAIRIHSLKILARTARILGPIIANVPISWIYPVGKAQEKTIQDWRSKYFAWAEVIAGDFHFIKRYAPENLQGKIILTNTTTNNDVEVLRKRGVTTLITTTPRYNGRSVATNVLEAAFIAVSGKYPLSPDDYRKLLEEARLEPDILQLN